MCCIQGLAFACSFALIELSVHTLHNTKIGHFRDSFSSQEQGNIASYWNKLGTTKTDVRNVWSHGVMFDLAFMAIAPHSAS